MNKHMYIILHYITNFFGNLGYLLEKDKIEIYAYVVWITMYRYISMFPLFMKENKRIKKSNVPVHHIYVAYETIGLSIRYNWYMPISFFGPKQFTGYVG